MQDEYVLLDSGFGRKLERFGPIVLDRPAAGAVWPKKQWAKADATFTRDPGGAWEKRAAFPESWVATVEGIQFKLSTTDFGHVGIFPEQRSTWRWIREQAKGLKVLNLFAYSGGVTMAALQGGAEVCHLDASKKMVAWARENAALNGLEKHPCRWIVEDALKFLRREERRGSLYDGVILDPPSFGRGAQGEVFKIEEDILPLLETIRKILTPNPAFVILSCHTPGFTPITLTHLLEATMPTGHIVSHEMVLEGEGFSLPSGAIARWCGRDQ